MRTPTLVRALAAMAFVALAVGTLPCRAADILPAERRTVWNPGLNSAGGIPNRTTVFATINAATYGNGSADATAGIQNAINNCPAGQVVQLSAGKFTINNDIVYLNKGITLRGAGSSLTTLQRTNGAVQGSGSPGVAKPVIIVGPSRWASQGTACNLAANAAKGACSVQLASAPAGGLSAGQIVLIDELSGAAWRTDPLGRGQVWASADFRVVYQRHNPAQGQDDPWPSSAGWFCRQDRPTCEIKEVQAYDAATKTVTFTTPFHIDYRTANTAQLYVYASWDKHVKNAGVEDLRLQGGDDGQLRFELAAYCWAARIENTAWLGEGFAIDHSFRVEVRDSYVHDPVILAPGGGSYNISLANGSSEILIENNISRMADKVMVARCSGAGSVVGYNYKDDGIIDYAPTWVEIGLNASHMVGPHHVLFEGNYCFNADNDNTHGNSILHTYFRNHLSGQRRSFTDEAPRRCAGLMAYSYWMSFVGNVLGRPGQMSGWVYETQNSGVAAIWMLGWDSFAPYPVDPNLIALTYRHGNFDYLTNTQKWDPTVDNHALPSSLYLTQKPAFFGSYDWPWVDPTGSTKLYTLPAKARYEAMIGLPVITAQPASLSVTVGQTATFGVTATGKAPLAYQWRKNGVNISGATSASYTTPATTLADSGAKFSVVVSNSLGSATSNEATLTVTAANRPPVISAFSPATPAAVPAGTTQAFSVEASDPDGDGLSYVWKLDGSTVPVTINTMNYSPLAADAGVHTIVVTVSDGKGGSVSQTWAVTVTKPGSTLRDFTGDGKADILWREAATGKTVVWTMNGATKTASAYTSAQAGTGWAVAGVADFTGDGKADILWRETATGKTVVWTMNGATKTASAYTSASASNAWAVAGVADFTGDGKADILWRETATGKTVVWTMDGATKTASAYTSASASNAWAVVQLSDFTGDGKADILWRETATGKTVVWTMDGATKTASAYTSASAGIAWTVQ
jgi:hypothetical protein